MSETVTTGLTKHRAPVAFAGSALIHTAFALLLLRMTLPQTSTRSSPHFVPVYVPAAVATNPLSAPAQHHEAPLRPRTLALPPPVRVPALAPELRSVSSPEAPPPVLSGLRPLPPPQIEPGAIKLSSPGPRVGAFDSPAEPARRQAPDLAASQVGKFEQPATSLRPGGSRDPIVSAGFDSEPADGPTRTNLSEGTVPSGSFATAEAPRSRGASPRAVTKTNFDSIDARSTSDKVATPDERASALEILDKPRPLYSEEARKLKIEGMVVLEMCFGADGHGRVLRVVRGLGHGLDENAIRAAMGIRFRPAVHRGRPIDTVGLVRIDFQVAY